MKRVAHIAAEQEAARERALVRLRRALVGPLHPHGNALDATFNEVAFRAVGRDGADLLVVEERNHRDAAVGAPGRGALAGHGGNETLHRGEGGEEVVEAGGKNKLVLKYRQGIRDGTGNREGG